MTSNTSELSILSFGTYKMLFSSSCLPTAQPTGRKKTNPNKHSDMRFMMLAVSIWKRNLHLYHFCKKKAKLPFCLKGQEKGFSFFSSSIIYSAMSIKWLTGFSEERRSANINNYRQRRNTMLLTNLHAKPEFKPQLPYLGTDSSS